MGFFDLNIPCGESSSSSTSTLKTTRIKIATKAMELGYSGIAYNRTIKGVMSDHDRCSISLLSLSTLLKFAPSLSSSVDFHRDLLRVPRASPFRQYTRLTVCADSVPQAQVLNSGNSVIKTYDLVAVRPLNQSAFDHACEKSEVDIISIDFSDKLPFRLKLPMVKAAVERGVYFEINYSDLIVDVQIRRQMISNAKLLVDWTRGKNLILSSAAPSVNELRGPYDVANLLSLLGLSMERAKAAISKNSRTLITNALRKKHFYKEAIRVEAIPSFGSKELSSVDLLKWDPISSGDGDLLLDDVAKSFSATSDVSKTVKAINFSSIVDSMSSHGFQVKDLLSARETLSQSLNNGENLLSATEVTETSVRAGGVSKHVSRFDLLHQTDQNSLHEINSRHHTSTCDSSSKLCLPGDNTDANAEETLTHTTESGVEPKNMNRSDVFKVIETEMQDMQLQKCIYTEVSVELANQNVPSDSLNRDMELDAACNSNTVAEENSTLDTTAKEKELTDTNNLDQFPSSKFDVVLAKDCVTCKTPAGDMQLDTAFTTDRNIGTSTSCENINVSDSLNEESKTGEKSDVILVEHNVVTKEVDKKDLEDAYLDLNDASLSQNASEGEKLGRAQNDGGNIVLSNHFPYMESCGAMEVKDSPSVANHELLGEVIMEDPKHGESDSDVDFPILVQSTSGKSRAKQRKSPQVFVSPFKRTLMNRISFKKKANKVKRRTKMV